MDNNRKKVSISQESKVKQRKKNGLWYNVLSTLSRFFRASSSDTEDITVSVKSGKVGQGILRGGLSIGAVFGGVMIASDSTALADEDDGTWVEVEIEDEDIVAGQTEVTIQSDNIAAETNTASEETSVAENVTESNTETDGGGFCRE